MITAQTSFYISGGTLPRDAPSYIERQADTDLLQGLRAGQFCYVLTSRQMGKSSLMVRTAERLRKEGVGVAVLDLTGIGQNLTPEQWYDGLLNLLGSTLELEDELEAFWFEHEHLGPLQRWLQGLREVVLVKIAGPVVVFVEEIDAVRSLPFSADEFFAGIRECYNCRAEDPTYHRLTFCLLGVATPTDLIRDTRTTPFNIGHRIELTDFTPQEALPLAWGLNHRDTETQRKGTADKDLSEGASLSQAVVSTLPASQRSPLPSETRALAREERFREGGPGGLGLLQRVLYWTGGHPYLTQRL